MKIIHTDNVFVLQTKSTHYVIAVNSDKKIEHLHWGKKCDIEDYTSFYSSNERNSNHSAADCSKTEYLPYGGTAYSLLDFVASYADSCRETVLSFDSFNISAKDDCELLEINLVDKAYNLFVTLCYALRDGTDIIERYTKVYNPSKDDVLLKKVSSGQFNLPSKRPYTSLNTNGSWGGEFRLCSTLVKNGTMTYDSRKGGSDHTICPYFILSQNADEKSGDVYFGALAWSGNFKAEINRDFSGTTRAVIGINDFDFSYILHPGESFVTPSVYCGYANGLSKMSNEMNSFALSHILPKSFYNKPLPVLYNSWEATFFDVDCASQEKLAEKAAHIGCELFVIDDGWFGQRKDDRAGLGDWYVNSDKFPDGLTPLINKVKSLGMDFGLWFEPEMVNPDSDLYRLHPEWTYHYKTREPSLLRHQLVLNLTRDDVKEFVFSSMDNMLSAYDIKYIKWDMNRAFSETGADNLQNPQELWFRHIAAVYEIADRLKAKYPSLQIECCASGGGRADLGALSHFDMVWTSDNTDPVDRLEIQHGYSMLYPIKCMRAWVTDTNRHSRPDDLDFRFAVAMQGSLSVGGNLSRYSEEELETHKKYISLYKEIRNTIQFGSFYRLADFQNDGMYATQYVYEDEVVVFICKNVNTFFNEKFRHLCLMGLESDAQYKFGFNGKDVTFGGAYLMNAGIDFEMGGTLSSWIIRMKKL